MHFISNGDYIFPFRAATYWAQHFYMWSFERGAANPDGIMRLPQRLLDIEEFALFGNIGIGYFYVLSCFVIAFFSFYRFARVFLGAERRGIAVLGGMFFALNPIFLGNTSKIGLVLAASMLPLMLAALHEGFTKRRFGYFFLYIVGLNIGLLHPFTFTVNLLASGIYIIYMCRQQAVWVRDHLWGFALLILAGLLLHMYCLLPLASLGTLDKSAVSDSVSSSSAPVDYTSLVDVANTGDIFTGLSLSKSVFKDYDFYSARTWPFYFLGVFVFYALLFGVYLKTEKRAKPLERRWFVISLAVFLVLLALATATFMHVDVLIKMMIGLPGGWMFRSPLKWQLYMALPLCTALVIAVMHVQTKAKLRLLYAGFATTFLLMNGYLFVQIFGRLFVPRQVTYFSALASMDLSGQNLLFVNADKCMAFARDNPRVATELNQLFISKNVQVKRVGLQDLPLTNLGQYDYVMGCVGTTGRMALQTQYQFTRMGSFANGIYELYKTSKPVPYISAVSQPFALDIATGMAGKYAFATANLSRPFNYVATDQNVPNAVGLQDIFGTITPTSLQKGTITATLAPVAPGTEQLYAASTQPKVVLTRQNTVLQIAPTTPKGPAPWQPSNPISVTVPAAQKITATYRDPSLSFANVVQNPSLEQGTWQKTIGDCNDYDDQADIGMRLDASSKNSGKQSLELYANKHIACTGPADTDVSPGDHYLLSFFYQTNGDYAGYHVAFDDLEQTTSGGRLPNTHGAWQQFSTELTVPEGGEKLQLLFYAYPTTIPGTHATAHYDDASLIHVPNIANKFYMVSNLTNTKTPTVTFSTTNPTQHIIKIQGADAPFYLSTKETYHPKWQLLAGNQPGIFSSAASAGAQHVRMNGSMNGWYINPTKLCAQHPAACIKTSNGYDITLTMMFAPQRWFYIGAIISAATLVGVLSYLAWEYYTHRQKVGKR